MDKKQAEFMAELSKRLIEEGRLLEVGFETIKRRICEPNGAEQPPAARDLRMAYFAGAQHLFATIVAVCDGPSDVATEEEEKRFEKIQAELDAVEPEVKKWLRVQ